MSIQQLMAQMQGMGFGELSPSQMGALSQEEIMQQSGYAAGLSDTQVSDMLTSGMFQGLNPKLLQSASMGAYSPMFQQKQGSMTGGLMQQLQAKPMKRAYGGFAGSGGAQHAQQQARDVYGQGMQDVLTQAMGAKHKV